MSQYCCNDNLQHICNLLKKGGVKMIKDNKKNVNKSREDVNKKILLKPIKIDNVKSGRMVSCTCCGCGGPS